MHDVGIHYGWGRTVDVCVQTECTDSDGGRNLEVRGTTIGINSDRLPTEIRDRCSEDGTRVIESYCDDRGRVFTSFANECPNGCKDGACKKPGDPNTGKIGNLPKGVYYGCYDKGGSTREWGSIIYDNSVSGRLLNSVKVNCAAGEEVWVSDATCNPRFWDQIDPVYIGSIASVSSPGPSGSRIKGRELACVGGESQGILNVICCKKS